MTLLSVVYPDGTRRSCDASCHNATGQRCACPCGGQYHGKAEGTWALQAALWAHHDKVMLALGAREDAGELWIQAYREALDRPLVRRPRRKLRTFQEPLALYLGEPD